MDIQVLSNSELITFIESEQYNQLLDVPITRLRAISQVNNPNADANDPALILAFNEDQEMIAYVGCLPEQLAIAPKEKVCWNSCWWVHPTKGSGASMPVFYKAIELWEAKIMFDDLPARSVSILKHLKFVHFEKIEGMKAMLHSKLSQIITNRFPKLQSLKSSFQLIDKVIDLLLYPYYYTREKGVEQSNLNIELISRVDDEANTFVKENSSQQLIQRNASELNWILDFPWLTTGENQTKDKRYYFSSYAESFKSHLFKIKENNEMVAFVFLSERDGVFTLPYFYCLEPYKAEVYNCIVKLLLLLKANTFVCYQPAIVELMKRYSFPFIYTKAVSKTVGIPNSLKTYFDQTPLLQDGDGDIVFT